MMICPSEPCFNSRLREEATTSGSSYSMHAWGFNSRLREEATQAFRGCSRADAVSTHASVRRRQRAASKGDTKELFQLTPP